MEPQSEKNGKKINVKLHLGDVLFVNAVSLKYLHWHDVHNINVGEMCFVAINVHNELFNGVRQLMCQHLSPVFSTFSTFLNILSFLFISTASSLPISLSFCPSDSLLFLWYPIPFSQLVVFACSLEIIC